jgi:NitT/TauT family transport system ATP-binding protein
MMQAGLSHVSVRGLTKVYSVAGRSDDLRALGPVDLELARGEFFALVGPSGCGKSTLLKVVAGLSKASEGTVELAGRPIAGEVPDGVGVVFQEDACFPWLSVHDNIAFGLRRQNLDAAEVRRRVHHAVELMGLQEFANSYPAQLSGGMRQRVCIARTMVLRPELILLDEPFGALDQQTRLLMGEELLKLWRDTGATVLLITHSLDEAAMLANRIGVMSARPGRLLDTIHTPWGRDRDSRIIERPEFADITTRIWKTLREETLKSMRGSRAP